MAWQDDVIKTMFGALIPIIKADFSTSSASAPSGVTPANSGNLWPVIDWAFSPVYAPSSTYYGYFYLDLGSVKTFDTLLVSHITGTVQWIGSPVAMSSSYNSDYTSPAYDTYVIAGNDTYIYPSGHYGYAGTNVYWFKTPQSARYLKVYIGSNGSLLQVPEIAIANSIAIKHNEQLSTFTRTPGTVNEQVLTMQNGRTVKIVTSKSTDKIHCSYVWSDDGTLATQLYNLFTELASNGAPLLWLPPIESFDTEHISNRKPEFLILDSIPEIPQDSATTWKMELSARCQP